MFEVWSVREQSKIASLSIGVGWLNGLQKAFGGMSWYAAFKIPSV
jgi:hypothetical protein